MHNQPKAYIYALVSILCWSTVGSAFKIGLRFLDFIQLLFYSVIVALVIYSFVLIWQKKFSQLFSFTAKDYLYSALLGLLNPFGYYMILFKAYTLLPAQIAQPLNYAWPVMLVLLSIPLLKQKLTLRSFLAIMISFTGVFLISSQGNLTNYEIKEPFGVLLAVSSSVIWALFWILNVRDKRDETVKLFLNFAFGLVYITISIFFFSEFRFSDYRGALGAGYIGFFELGIPFILWLKALKFTSSMAKISNLVFLSPFLALFFIHLILGENIYSTTFIGLIFIITGIFIQQIKQKTGAIASNG
jgi:drug/metabolite transporter (DMT)-like permease